MTDLWSYLKRTDKKIILYGTGNGAEKIINKLNREEIPIYGIFSSDGFKKNKEFCGFTVTDFKSLKDSLGEIIILVCFGSHLPEVIEKVKNFEENYELYFPDVPVYGDDIFDLEFAKRHKNELIQVYEMLCDKKSKKVFENTVLYKLTGKGKYLYNSESDRKEVFELLNLDYGVNFFDLGAYNGDTIEEFLKYCKNYGSITAVEPDKRNFKKLTDNTKGIHVNLVNAAMSDSLGTTLISYGHGRGNGRKGKTTEVDTVTIDFLSKEVIPNYIKIDVEGAEMKTISGAVNCLTKNKPKLHIACYHNSYDIFTIPLKIKEICPDYKLYMRKHPCFPAWDINYIFI